MPQQYTFANWKDAAGNIIGTNPSVTVTVPPEGGEIFASYRLASTQHMLQILSGSGGTTTPTPGQYLYDVGTAVLVTALPSSGYLLNHWMLDGNILAPSNPIQIIMNTAHVLQPVFDMIPDVTYVLTLLTSAGGTTNPAPGKYIHGEGTVVQVTATPNSGYKLDHWELDGSTIGAPNPYSVQMSADHDLIAIFAALSPIQYVLTIQASAGGTTVPAPGSYLINHGTTIQVRETVEEGYLFHHWELDGNSIGSSQIVTITVNATHTLSAIFQLIPTYDIVVTVIRQGLPAKDAIVKVKSGPTVKDDQLTNDLGRTVFTELLAGNHVFEALYVTEPGMPAEYGTASADPSITPTLEIVVSETVPPKPSMLPWAALAGLAAFFGAIVYWPKKKKGS